MRLAAAKKSGRKSLDAIVFIEHPPPRNITSTGGRSQHNWLGKSADRTVSGGLPHTRGMNKPINWFEIPALDFARAKMFYETILGVALREETVGAASLAIFPYDRGSATGGCVMKGADSRPSQNGVTIYLNTDRALDAVLERVRAAGGEIALPKTPLPPGMGAIALIVDPEGNRVGLHEEG